LRQGQNRYAERKEPREDKSWRGMTILIPGVRHMR
jgi:hypothetical protein